MIVRDLGQMPYRDAWAEQQRVHEAVVGGAEEQLLLVEHPPVVTLGRRPDVVRNLISTPEQLAARGVELVETDRGGDVTFHGPGQLVAYPIVRLIDHQLSVGGYVHRLEDAIVSALGNLGIPGHRDACAVGVWVKPTDDQPAAKVAAIGVRVRQGATLHGLALNVTTDLAFFDLIIPCGLKNRPVTSIQRLLSPQEVSITRVKRVLADRLTAVFQGTPSAVG
ncbi:MAG TPA: lipoyl(octanoyl) transferase LipB [Tepidisphaeraceae bacterium]|jgi:lipoyl(octanoyl) transferase|nr:lipoyl(octanoyl) transferase LipB [Tepidisphaeraceae bacterium]